LTFQRINRRRLLAADSAAVTAAFATSVRINSARAQSFPSGQVTFIAPFPPGDSTDVAFRLVAGKLAQMWGQPVVIDNEGEASAATSSEINEKLFGMGGPMTPTTPDELRAFTLSEIEAWRKVAKAANIRIE
jgi:tripartite-type tricarboxylate transporter receptor subunit TctC